MTNGKTLGLDIGVASVGVEIIDNKTGEIIHKSVRLFSEANADNNATRRTSRSSRRLMRRKKHRIKRVEDLFATHNFDISFKNLNLNPYELRVKGLTDQLTNEELFAALKSMVKRRGISYLDDAGDDSPTGSSDYAQAIERNRQLLQDKTPGQIQLERLKKYGQIRGDFDIVDENGVKQRVINVFSTSEYKQEAQKILETQAKHNEKVTKEFIEDYLDILISKRKYYVGPGNEKSRTDYGIYRTNGKTWTNLFSILIGKCSYYPDEDRAAKASYTAQEYNFLNDLNNLTVPTETKKLTTQQKEELVTFAKKSKAPSPAKLLKKIAKQVGCQESEIKGYRLDKNDKPELHTFEIYRLMTTLETIDVHSLNRETLDSLGRILTLNTDREGIQEAINTDLAGQFSDQQISELISFRKNKSQKFGNGWHSFSVKLMLELIPELYATSEEQMTILHRLGKQKATKHKNNRTKYIDEHAVTEEIYNPVVAKSVRQTIKIINQAIKKWKDFDQIVIEMPRDKNSEDEKKFIDKRQKENAKLKDAAMKHAANLYNGKDELPNSVFHGHKTLATKIRLWYQQGDRCLYTGQYIDIHDLVNNPNKFEIDHILPLSLSFDDSLANKVLVLATANQDKGQQTPFQAIPQMQSAWSYHEFKDYVTNCKGLDKKKRQYLLTEEDIDKFDVRKKFIERNLVDTRYASRVVLNTLQEAMEDMGKSTKISVVRGQFTAQLRRKWKIDKSRDTYHHHAVDALIIAASSQLKLWEKMENPMFTKYDDDHYPNSETDELISNDDYKEYVFSSPYAGFVNTITDKGFEEEILFSYQVDSKVNRKISDANIYTTRPIALGKDKEPSDYFLRKLKDIYSIESFKDFLKRYQRDKTQFLIYQKDPATWEQVIEKIMNLYSPFKEINDKGKEVLFNPFEKYRQEFGPIRKYSRKGNGPEIKNFKYYAKKLGNHIDITLEGSKHKTALLSINPWRSDVYFNPQTMKYEIMGIKYADLGFEKGSGRYGISPARYHAIKAKEGISEISEFKFSLYKNDLILIKDTKTKDSQLFRFLSRSNPNQKYNVELKPYDKSSFDAFQQLITVLGNADKDGRTKRSLNKENLSIYKVKTDVLGQKYFVKSEGPKPKLNFKFKSGK